MPPPRTTTRYPSVYRSGKATYRYVLDLDSGPDGKRRQESRGGYRSAEDAHKARTARLSELHRGVNTDPSRQTVAEYLGDWLKVRAHSVRPSTVRVYGTCIDTRIVPFIGQHPVPKLAPSHLRAWHAALSKTHKPASIRQAHVVLSMALGDAVDDGALARNVARLVTPPQPEDAEKRALTVDEIAQFLAVADTDTEAALWRVALLTGLRRGELQALRWSDVDLTTGHITIRQTVTTDEIGRRIIGPGKSKASLATLALDETCKAALRRQAVRVKELRLRAPYWDDNDLVFPRKNGEPFAATTINARLAELCAQAGVPRLSMHNLRHSTASALYEIGYDLLYIQQQLRHANVGITARVYVHLTGEQQRQAAERLTEAIAEASRRRVADSG